MRTRLLALVALVVGHGLASAQPDSVGLHAEGEVLLWWCKNGGVPPLVTSGSRVLVDSLDFDDGVRPGARFTLVYRDEAMFGVEASYFFLPSRVSAVRFSSAGEPPLSQPYIDAATGAPTSNGVAFPGVTAGSVSVTSRLSLWGAEANLTADLLRDDTAHLTALAGYRFLRLEDEVTSREHFAVSPAVPGFGGNTVGVADEFRSVNRFHGGQLGLEAGARLGRVTLDVRGKVALGQMEQVGHVSGAFTVLSPAGAVTNFPSGLYALETNGGRHLRRELAIVPEVGVKVGWQVTRHARLYAGYSFLWVSNVARAGDQIDPVLNETLIRVKSPPGPLVGPARPAFRFDGTDFWAQGVSVGLELRY